jgi:hypothetical protein
MRAACVKFQLCYGIFDGYLCGDMEKVLLFYFP